MSEPATTALLDTNIYDRLQREPGACTAVAAAITARVLRVIVTPKVRDELEASPFRGVPEWFPVDHVVESVAVLDHWRMGEAALGAGEICTAHRGASEKVADAIIADSANTHAHILVTEDRRLRKRLAEAGSTCVPMSFDAFQAWLAGRA